MSCETLARGSSDLPTESIGWAYFGAIVAHFRQPPLCHANVRAMQLELLSFCVEAIVADAPITRTQSNDFSSRLIQVSHLTPLLASKPQVARHLIEAIVAAGNSHINETRTTTMLCHMFALALGERERIPSTTASSDASAFASNVSIKQTLAYVLAGMHQTIETLVDDLSDVSQMRLVPLVQRLSQQARDSDARAIAVLHTPPLAALGIVISNELQALRSRLGMAFSSFLQREGCSSAHDDGHAEDGDDDLALMAQLVQAIPIEARCEVLVLEQLADLLYFSPIVCNSIDIASCRRQLICIVETLVQYTQSIGAALSHTDASSTPKTDTNQEDPDGTVSIALLAALMRLAHVSIMQTASLQHVALVLHQAQQLLTSRLLSHGTVDDSTTAPTRSTESDATDIFSIAANVVHLVTQLMSDMLPSSTLNGALQHPSIQPTELPAAFKAISQCLNLVCPLVHQQIDDPHRGIESLLLDLDFFLQVGAEAYRSFYLEQALQAILTTMKCLHSRDSGVLSAVGRVARTLVIQSCQPASFSYFFENHLSDSVGELLTWDRLAVEHRDRLLGNVLDMGTLVLKEVANRYKVFVIHVRGILRAIGQRQTLSSPKESLEACQLERAEILSSVVDVVSFVSRRGTNAEFLMDTIPMLLSIANTTEKLELLLPKLADKFETNGSYAQLLDMKYAYEYCCRHFGTDEGGSTPNDLLVNGIADFFCELIGRTRRQECNIFWRVCKSIEISHARYRPLVNMLFGIHGSRKVTLNELVRLLPIIDSSRAITSCPISNSEVVFCESILNQTEALLQAKKFSQTASTSLLGELMRLNLLRSLFPTRLSEVDRLVLPAPSSATDVATNSESSPSTAPAPHDQTPVEGEECSTPCETPPPPFVLQLERFSEQDRERVRERVASMLVSTFPPEVAADSVIMESLLLLSKRITTVTTERPKYLHVCDIASDCVAYFLSCHAEGDSDKARLKHRKQLVQQHVAELPENRRIRQHLMSVGYSDKLWHRDLYLTMDIELQQRDATTAFQSALLESYSEYIDILTSLKVTEIMLPDGQMVAVANDTIFKSHMTIDELKSMRLHVTKIIRQHKSEANHAMHCVHQQLERERQLEDSFLQQLKQQRLHPESLKKHFVVRLNTSFLRTLSTCSGGGTSGCYAPDGVHAEKPIENALKCNAIFISIFEEKDPEKAATKESRTIAEAIGTEIENVEVLFTDQGAYFFKLYSSGHTYDTSYVWLHVFKTLLDAHLVPAIILPNGFPTARTFSLVKRFVQPELCGTVLSIRDDFFQAYSTSSYYDIKPDKINPGDVVLTPESVSSFELPAITRTTDIYGGERLLRSSSHAAWAVPPPEQSESSTDAQQQQQRTKQPRQAANKARVQRDLAGELITRALAAAQQNPVLAAYRQTLGGFAKFFADFASKYVSTGEASRSILSRGFDLNRWNNRTQRRGGPTAAASPSPDTSAQMTEATKQLVIRELLLAFAAELDRFYRLTDEELEQLLQQKQTKLHYYELRLHLERLSRLWRTASRAPQPEASLSSFDDEYQLPSDKQQACPELGLDLQRRAQLEALRTKMRYRMSVSSHIHPLVSLPLVHQKEIVRWAFWNEDKVWRHRGGRAEDTVNVFLQFVAPLEGSKAASKYYGGLVLLSSPVSFKTSEVSDTEADGSAVLEYADSIIGYALGEFIADDKYEIVTAWVDKTYGLLGFATEMYLKVMYDVYLNFGCKYVKFDTKEGAFEEIVRSSTVLSALAYCGVDKLVVQKLGHTYEQTLQGGTTERFEGLVLYLPPLISGIRVYSSLAACGRMLGLQMPRVFEHVDEKPSVAAAAAAGSSLLDKVIASTFIVAAGFMVLTS